MISGSSAWKHISDQGDSPAKRWFRIALWTIAGALSILKFFRLTADFPNDSPWMIDQAKFTDEGWWANAAVMHGLLGHWHIAGDYNPAVAVPVWPALLGMVFHFTGVGIVAARALNVVLSIATLGIVFVLVRRYTSTMGAAPALVAVLLLAASPFAFAFNRLAILETPVIFEFCLLLLVASFASAKRIWPLAALPVLVTAMILTKTTAALLVPAIFWMAWNAMYRKLWSLLRVSLAVGVLPAALLKAYSVLVSALGYGADYKYFFGVNGMPDIAWGQAFATIYIFWQNCFWIDRVLYPVGLFVLLLSLAWMRRLWRNPLFAASWIALAAQAAFIFSRQDDYAPRYFLVMLPPLVLIVVLAFGELRITHPKTAAIFLLPIAISAGSNVAMIVQFVTHPEYQYYDAALSIREIIRSEPEHNQLIFGVSGSQLSLMTGIPSINDAYSTQDMAEKVARYNPGWYLAWNGIADENHTLLSPFQMIEIASYPVFDDDDRNKLILYKMVRRAEASTSLPPAGIRGSDERESRSGEIEHTVKP
jgi:hypothetical protein